MRKLILTLMIFSFFLAGKAYPYWIWTPKTGKWVNPKTSVKSSPKEQFDFAKGQYDIKNYTEAKREFKKLLRSYPKAVEAPEAQYYLGLIDEAEDDLYGAFQSYQKIIDKYPFSERITEIIEREYKIGEMFMSGHKRKAMGMNLPVENPAIEIFTKVIENSTYGPIAAKAQYKLALVLKGLGRYYEAEEAFDKVITNYPQSEWVIAAKYQKAACKAALSKGPDYDQQTAKEAKQSFEDFVKEHPDAILSSDAEKNVEDLKEKEAESYYTSARFYEKQKAFAAAKIYYNEVVNNYSKSPWAAKAAERLKFMEKERK